MPINRTGPPDTGEYRELDCATIPPMARLQLEYERDGVTLPTRGIVVNPDTDRGLPMMICTMHEGKSLDEGRESTFVILGSTASVETVERVIDEQNLAAFPAASRGKIALDQMMVVKYPGTNGITSLGTLSSIRLNGPTRRMRSIHYRYASR